MVGASIATTGAAPWITDFLNAAYFGRKRAVRRVEDLRLAYGILDTRWAELGRRLAARDLREFHRAFGASRIRGRGRLDPEALLAGSASMFGDWFPDAWGDPARRAYGVAFATPAARAAFDPGLRLRHGTLRELTPPHLPPEQQVWATYPPVPLPNPAAALELLSDPARWPDIASVSGRFVPVRTGGLAGQTFEILLSLHPSPHTLVTTRGHVTCTDLHAGGPGLARAVAALNAHVPAVPDRAEPLALIELTTHDGHFMGRGISRLVVYSEQAGAFVRDVGSWDPLPPHLAAGYKAGGHKAQVAFWGPAKPDLGMLAQLALVTA